MHHQSQVVQQQQQQQMRNLKKPSKSFTTEIEYVKFTNKTHFKFKAFLIWHNSSRIDNNKSQHSTSKIAWESFDANKSNTNTINLGHGGQQLLKKALTVVPVHFFRHSILKN